MTDHWPFTALELVTEARRELKLRRQVYPNRVHTGRLSQRQADRQIAMQEAIVEILTELEKAERLL